MKLDKDVIIKGIFGLSLATSLFTLSGCVNSDTNLSDDIKTEEVTIDNSVTGVVYNGDVAMIINEDDLYTHFYDDTGYHSVVENFGDNVILFYGDENLTSYEKAFKFAKTIVGEDGKVYDYDYVMGEEANFAEVNGVSKILC